MLIQSVDFQFSENSIQNKDQTLIKVQF